MPEMLLRNGSGTPSTDTHEPKKHLIVPPVAAALGQIELVQQRNLAASELHRDRHITVGSPEVAVPLWNLVVTDKGITPDGGRRGTQESMILMGILHSGCQNHISVR